MQSASGGNPQDLAASLMLLGKTTKPSLSSIIPFLDSVLGGSGNDFLSGGSGNDIVIGGLGNDFIFEGSGNDTLIGVDPTSNNPGMNETDRLNGGAGKDTFVIGDKNNPYYVGGEELMVSMTLL
ncbi:calcium-binding protein [Moorena bouillonii]|uniref:Uncharacterized protein n=1 Tax=Moorena bouillonii PNG TaxID=568701 RepID=A0A1U7N4D9_9CYAN|nr:hypothetical protein [Moorena bouillonii]OLT60823.1 hypothetical protein BJP37_19190 [Moorena bouillonii PNG]